MSSPNRIAVICPGSSHGLFPGPDGYMATIGVNRAAIWHQCDYLVCRDAHTWRWIREQGGPWGRPAIVTERAVYEKIRADDAADAAGVLVNSRSIQAPMLFKVAWRRLGSLTAIALAAERLSAQHEPGTQWAAPGCIELFGMDLTGTADADGFQHPKQWRDKARWAKESRLLAECTALLAAHGIDVRRHQPAGETV